MRASLHLSNNKVVEINNLQKVIKSGPHGSSEITKDNIKNTLFSNGSYTFVGDITVAIGSATIEFIEFID
ncbi:hypothetical protein [Staphylococcus capitis]|uniref:hypothetical protein n=1 Tax=Staphylococcus capitis TaxID=29388 RepID=UPI0018891CF6|nr:hypothetical protein [Staphylococcus capitis]HBO2457056.1 hypothetical protein [Pseudomonas aeruginosa]MBF2242929.1 hypothetical protein [Staphylococcus capitis]MBF2247936.1 hypothetical protein [Staphylococcus capitis]MBF8029172.1 hypothetical protein [Staphylococcus capitis]MBF8049445.1 hypothetical protein [Staphylococcus capitis]